MFPQTHTSTNWANHMTVVVHSVLKREYGYTCKFEKKLINKVAATILGKDLSHFDFKPISRDDIRKIASHLAEKARKQHEENQHYELRSKHLWAKKSYDYKTRIVEENLQAVYDLSTTIDTMVIGEFKAVMLVPRILLHKSLA